MPKKADEIRVLLALFKLADDHGIHLTRLPFESVADMVSDVMNALEQQRKECLQSEQECALLLGELVYHGADVDAVTDVLDQAEPASKPMQ